MKCNSLAALSLCLITVASEILNAHLTQQLPSNRIMYGSDGMKLKKTKTPVKHETEPRGVIGDCTNGPTTRNCWIPGYTVADDFDKKWPTTGVTRYYTLTLTNITCNPDGNHERYCSLINGQNPGPLITANWGDWLEITVVNNLQYNGTSLHWHGMRQLNSYQQDGVNGITQCPLAPGNTQIYKFQATQFGTSWYHSHHSAQYGDGVAGPLVINGPSSANWDIDLGPITMQDWFYQSAFAVNLESVATQQQHVAPPTADNVLVNGMNMDPSYQVGRFMNLTLTPGKKHLLRLINMATDNTFRFSIDGHTMQILTADFVPTIPIMAESVLLAVGQRYDVIITANGYPGNYWLRAESETACLSYNNGIGLGVVNYAGSWKGLPSTNPTYTNGGNCIDPSPLTPWVQNQVGDQAEFISQATNLGLSFTSSQLSTNNQSIVVWGLNFTAIAVDWKFPTISYLMDKTVGQIPASEALVEIASNDEWVFWIIQEVAPNFNMPHPMHLHGHDFYVLGTGVGTFDIKTDPAKLTYWNPTRRDTANLPAGGWMVMAFPTDNPGAWLMHCHLAVHISEGLGVQFLESVDKMTLPSTDYTNQCTSWDGYAQHAIYKQELSGL